MSQKNLEPKNLYNLLSKYIGKFLQIIAGVNFAAIVLATCLMFLYFFVSSISMGAPVVLLLGILILPVGLVLACVSAAPLFAFGQVVDDIHALRMGKRSDDSDELPTL